MNLEPHPGLETIQSILREVRERPDVQDVLVEVTDEAEASVETWPYAERLYVLTSASEEIVREWNERLAADGPVEGWAAKPPPAAPPLKEGYKVWQIIWD